MKRSISRRKYRIALGVLTLLASGVAFGDAPAGGGGGGGTVEVQLNAKAQDPRGKTKDDAPTIEATIVGGPNVPLDQFTISEANAKVPLSIKAATKRDYNQGSETIAIALVINGQEIGIGNDDIPEVAEGAKYVGVLKGLKTALQNVPFSTAGPAGSLGVLVTYGDKADIKVPMGPLSNLTSEALGTQKDYYQQSGTAMVQGIQAALTELHKVQTAQKAMIIVCDGNDTNNTAAVGQLAALKKQALADHIQTFAIIYKGQLSDPANVISTMIPAPKTVNSADDIATMIKAILAAMANRYYVTFPGFDKTSNMGLTWDNKSHDLIVKIGKDDTDPVSLQMSPKWDPPKPMSLWWLAIVIPVVLLILIIVAVKLFSSKSVEQVEMPVMAPMMAAPAEAPKPAGPMKTVMFNAGGTDDGFPIVGWLVALNGPNAFQTLRLRSTITKIGTKEPADLVINDGFMSTEHCQISCSPQGYSLIDGGSTNGSYVNDKKVSRQEIMDGDTITLGKTNFKFKSIGA
jgi:hypothetical protein